jgi:putative PIN family toxin of toxin-antitoxin system
LTSVTADTNIYISGFEFGGLPRRFIDLAAAGEYRLGISDAIINEILRVLRVKFQWNAEGLRGVEEDVGSYAQLVTPTQTLDVIKADPPDNRILECAVTAENDFILSGDGRHLLPLVSYNDTPIVKVADFLELLKQEQA